MEVDTRTGPRRMLLPDARRNRPFAVVARGFLGAREKFTVQRRLRLKMFEESLFVLFASKNCPSLSANELAMAESDQTRPQAAIELPRFYSTPSKAACWRL